MGRQRHRQTYKEIKANEMEEEIKGDCADQVHRYTVFQETNYN